MAIKDITRDAIMRLLIDEPGIMQKDIAARLKINEGTVSRHVRAIRAERERSE